MSFLKSLVAYPFFENIIYFVKNYFRKRKHFYPGYYFIYPQLNQSLKWCFDYVVLVKSKPTTKKMEDLLDRFYDKLESSLKRKYNRYVVKVSQAKGWFYVLVRKPRGKILNEELDILYKDVKNISTKVYNRFAEDSSTFRHNFFPFFKLGRHFLVARKDYKF